MATNALRRADGYSVDVTLSYEVDEGDIVVVQDWVGIVSKDGESGDSRALNVENAEFDMILPTGLAAEMAMKSMSKFSM
jgi:predicted RecA/RadA family phage recombinase